MKEEEKQPKIRSQHRSQSDDKQLFYNTMIEMINSNAITEEIINTLEDLNEKMDTYNDHLKTKNQILYAISVILFGIFIALLVI